MIGQEDVGVDVLGYVIYAQQVIPVDFGYDDSYVVYLF